MKTNNYRQVLDAIILRKVSFSVSFFIVFLLTYAILAWLDFLPEPVSETEQNQEVRVEKRASDELLQVVAVIDEKINIETNDEDNNEIVAETEEVITYLPEKIIFDSLNKKSVTVLNPTSRKIEDLDQSLLSGVVRHPDSATLGQNGTVFILGHSSYLPTVLNQNFKAFNNIQNLKWGETIRVQSGNEVYVYRVDKVYRATATDTTVPIAGDRQRLVLATCNSFGSIDDRYIVEADFVEIVFESEGG